MATLKIAVVAPMYNEESMLPHFLRHYSCFADKILLLDNESTDGSVGIARCHPKVEVRKFKSNGYDEQTVLDQIAAAKSELSHFDWVLFPDIDEFVISQPMRMETKLLSETKADILECQGYCMMYRKQDPQFDLSAPISRICGGYYPSKPYSKPIIIRGRAKMHFGPGKHALIPGEGVVVSKPSSFVLIHAEMIDFTLWRYRKNRRPLSQKNIEMGWAIGHFCKTEEQHRQIWNAHLNIPLVKVPFSNWSERYS